jgi:cell wall-associated NlpC family hydrolase
MARKISDYLLNTHTPNGRKYPNLDCWGLIVDVYRERLGIELSEYTDLSQSDMSVGLAYERHAGRFIEVKEPQNYDVVAFFVCGRLYHVGIWIDGKVLHTSQKKNCRYEIMDRVALSHRRYYRYAKGRDCK